MVGKLNPAGTAFQYLTYLGGSTIGGGEAIVVDSAGDAYITGSPGANFPTTANALSTTASPVFVTELDPTGSNLLYSTFVPGGFQPDNFGLAAGIAVSGAGNIFVTGAAGSGFVTTAGAYQSSFVGSSGHSDAFLAEFNPALSGAASLVYGSYLGTGGGSFGDEGTGIALDSSGNAYISGIAGAASFPTTPGAFQTAYLGNVDMFVAKLNPSLSGAASLVYSTLLGGTGGSTGFVGENNGADPYNPGPGIAVDSSGDAYVTGGTSSSHFPTTPGAFQTALAGTAPDAFVTKFNASGSGLVYSTYLGGSVGHPPTRNYVPAADCGIGIALNAHGDATVTGVTGSTNFPTKNPIQATSQALTDAFVTTLNASGSGLIFSTYLGGGGSSVHDIGCGVALDPAGNIYMAGFTHIGAPTITGFVYKITAPVLPSVKISAPTGTTAGNAFSNTVTDAMTASASVTVAPAAASTLAISGPSSVSSGKAFSITITALDAFGNVASGYTGTVHFSSSDGTATLPANHTFTASDNGTHTVSGVNLRTGGNQTITVDDTRDGAITGEFTTNVT